MKNKKTGRKNNKHVQGSPCPLTGEPIPDGFIFTAVERPGELNACGACHYDKRTVGARLVDMLHAHQAKTNKIRTAKKNAKKAKKKT